MQIMGQPIKRSHYEKTKTHKRHVKLKKMTKSHRETVKRMKHAHMICKLHFRKHFNYINGKRSKNTKNSNAR